MNSSPSIILSTPVAQIALSNMHSYGSTLYYEWPWWMPHSALGQLMQVLGMFLSVGWFLLSIVLIPLGLLFLTDKDGRLAGISLITISAIALYSINASPFGGYIPTIIVCLALLAGYSHDQAQKRE